MAPYDLLIVDGTVYDGSGSDWFRADIAVRGDTIELIRGLPRPPATRTIEARGMAVCPGFIDMHAHSTMVLLTDPLHEAKVRQGVTTELIGVDGNSYAPFLDAVDLERWAVLDAGLDGSKPPGLSWSSVDEYLALYDRKVPVNVAYVIGNSALRIATVGWDDRSPSETEMAKQKHLLRQGILEGAFGVSTGLTYPPGSYASTDELSELATVVRELGGFHVSHVRYGSGDGFLDPFREVLEVSRASGVVLHLSHYASLWKVNGQFKALIDLVEEARKQGLEVTFDAYPYNQGGSRAIVALPEWINEGGPDALLARLGDPAERERMRAESDPRQARWRVSAGWHLTGFTSPQNLRFDGMNLHGISELLDKDPLDALCDLLLQENLALSYVGHDSNNHVTFRKLLAHPLCMVGSDGLLVGSHPSPRTYGTFPKMLGDLVREEGFLTLSEAIRKMTSLPARLLELSDRGVIRTGAKADLVVFDPETVRSRATLTDPCVFPEGISHVIVNGVIVIDDGVHTGATPGRALKKSGS